MVMIYFTQCDIEFDADASVPEREFRYANLLKPIIPRCADYEDLLRRIPHARYFTLDENFILIAQYLHRLKKIEVKLMSVCNCGERRSTRLIELDDDGDMLDDPHHGFFPQRLRYLR